MRNHWMDYLWAVLGLAMLTGAESPASAAPVAQAAPSENAAAFDERVAALDRVFANAAKEGGAFLFRYDLGDRTVARGYGFLDCAGTIPMRADVLVDGGSITKDFTRVAIFKLVEQGRLGLDDPLSRFFPNIPKDKAGITVSQLLEMASGLPDYVRDGQVIDGSAVQVEDYDYVPLTREAMLDSAFRAPLAFAPGTKSEYSNLAFQVLGAIIELRSGKDYERYVRDVVFVPAKMESTGYRLANFRGKTFADQCRDGKSWGNPVDRGYWKNDVSWNLLGAGGMMTTLDDLHRFNQAMEGGVFFRPDIQARFRQSMTSFLPKCRTEFRGFAGSNGMTVAAYFTMPQRKESLVGASTRSDHSLLKLGLVGALCPT